MRSREGDEHDLGRVWESENYKKGKKGRWWDLVHVRSGFANWGLSKLGFYAPSDTGRQESYLLMLAATNSKRRKEETFFFSPNNVSPFLI